MQLKVLFGRKSHGHQDPQQSRVFFSTILFMSTLTLITKKELERVIEKNGDQFRWKKHVKIS